MSRNITEMGYSSLLLYYYHMKIVQFMKEAKFDTSINTLELYCKFNPGYNILSNSTNDEKTVLARLHTKQLNNFYKFTTINRVCEILQNYASKILKFPKDTFKYISEKNPMILKNINIDNATMKYLPLITKSNYEVVDSFVDFLERNEYQADNQMGELFDNRIFDMYSSFDIIVNSYSYFNHHKNEMIEIRESDYKFMLKWLIDHIDDSLSIFSRDTLRFFQVLKTFIFIHHIHELIGGNVFNDNQHYNKNQERTYDDFIKTRDPLIIFKHPKNIVDRDYNYLEDQYAFIRYDFKKIYQTMGYYGHLTKAECLCTKVNILPTRADERTNSTDIVDFLSMQEYIYKDNNRSNECSRNSR